MNNQPEMVVEHLPEEHRYVALLDGDIAGELRYIVEPGVLVLAHTEIKPSLRRRGVGGALVKGALDDIRTRGLRVVPACLFVVAYLEDHPEQADLVVGGAAA